MAHPLPSDIQQLVQQLVSSGTMSPKPAETFEELRLCLLKYFPEASEEIDTCLKDVRSALGHEGSDARVSIEDILGKLFDSRTPRLAAADAADAGPLPAPTDVEAPRTASPPASAESRAPVSAGPLAPEPISATE